MDIFIRLVAGGLVVSAFAVLADVLRPKSFAGLFGAAPSVALECRHGGGSPVAIDDLFRAMESPRGFRPRWNVWLRRRRGST